MSLYAVKKRPRRSPLTYTKYEVNQTLEDDLYRKTLRDRTPPWRRPIILVKEENEYNHTLRRRKMMKAHDLSRSNLDGRPRPEKEDGIDEIGNEIRQ